MATLPYFALGPSTILSALGLVRGPDRTIPTPAEDWRRAVVDVIIPALNEGGAASRVGARLKLERRFSISAFQSGMFDSGNTIYRLNKLQPTAALRC